MAILVSAILDPIFNLSASFSKQQIEASSL